MFTLVTVVLGMVGAALMVAFPAGSVVCFIAAYFAGMKITVADFEGFFALLFCLGAIGFVAACASRYF